MWFASLCSLALLGCAVVSPNPFPDPSADPSPDPSAAHGTCCGYHGYCHSEAKGCITESVLRVPEIEMPPGKAEFNFVIPDKCREWGRELAGSVVHACDSDVTPELGLGEAGVGPASVLRRGNLRAPGNVYMKQYCV